VKLFQLKYLIHNNNAQFHVCSLCHNKHPTLRNSHRVVLRYNNYTAVVFWKFKQLKHQSAKLVREYF